MENQEYKIKSDTFELKDIFDCGQCFRWNKQPDNSYIGVVKKNVIKVAIPAKIKKMDKVCQKNFVFASFIAIFTLAL